MMDRGGTHFVRLVFHELRFKSNRGLIAQRAMSAALVVPAFDADKELLFGGGVVRGHLAAKHFGL